MSLGFVSFAVLFALQRLKSFEPAGAPIADLKYDPTSMALAYAVSYDWNKASVSHLHLNPKP